MLLVSLQSKSNHLEQKYFKDDLNKGEIIQFLDAILEAIPNIVEVENYSRALDLVRKWKVILLSKYSEDYEEELRESSIREESTIELVFERQRHAIELLKEHAIFERGVDVSEENINVIAFPGTTLDPRIGFSNEVSKLISEEKHNTLLTKYAYKLLVQITNAELLYRQGEIDESSDEYLGIIGLLDGKIEHLNTFELFYIGWTLHGIAINNYAKEYYISANNFFSHSLKLKEKFLKTTNQKSPFFIFAYFSTRLRVIATSISGREFDLYKWNSDLRECFSEFKLQRDRLVEYNEKWTQNIEMDFAYYIGKSYQYLTKCKEAHSYFDQSIKIAQLLKNRTKEIRSIAHNHTEEFSSRIEGIRSIVSEMDEEEKSRPSFRRLFSDSHISEFKVLDRGFGEEFHRLSEELEIESLGEESTSLAVA